MSDPIIFMFSGQGSQYYHMGKELFESNDLFRKWMLRLDDVGNKIIGESILRRLFAVNKTKANVFNRTLYTSPSIFMVEFSLAQTLIEMGVLPSYVIGASLGEYTAATVSGIIGFEDSLKIIIKQAEIFENSCQKGGMIAIIHNQDLFYSANIIKENSELAAINCDHHFVVSGEDIKLKTIETFLKKKEIIYQRLPVSFGFHSSNIEPGILKFREMLRNKETYPALLPFISSLYADFLKKSSDDYFCEVVRRPILFKQAIERLEDNQPYNYLDLGPSGTLSNFVKNIVTNQSRSKTYDILNPFSGEKNKLLNIKKLFSAYIFKT